MVSPLPLILLKDHLYSAAIFLRLFFVPGKSQYRTPLVLSYCDRCSAIIRMAFRERRRESMPIIGDSICEGIRCECCSAKKQRGSKDGKNRLRGRRRREEGGVPQLCASFSIRGKFSLQQCCMYVGTYRGVVGSATQISPYKELLFRNFFKKINSSGM